MSAKTDMAAYLAPRLTELAELAKRNRLDLLAHLLEIAALQAATDAAE